MKIVTIIVRILLGLVFVAGGVSFFLMKQLPPPPPGHAEEFMTALVGSHYLHAVKVFEIVGGLLLIIGRFVPFGLTLLGPVIVNILFYNIFMYAQGLPINLVIAALALFLLWRYRSAFAGLVKA